MPPGNVANGTRGDASEWPLLERPVNAELTFESMVPCKVNDFPLELARMAAAEGGEREAFNPLYVYGDVGVGKTHLLSAIANASSRKNIRYVNTADLELEHERAARKGRRAELRDWLTSADMLLVDDIQLCEKNEALQLELFAVLNHLIRDNRAVVIASDVPPTRLRGVESRLLSRLGSGVIVGLGLGNRNERMEIVRRHARGVDIPAAVAEYLAEQITDSVRRLRAAVVQLVAIGKTSGIPIDLDLARAIVPMPGDTRGLAASQGPRAAEAPPVAGAMRGKDALAERFRRMMMGAETEQEQRLALEIALGEGVRACKAEGQDPERLRRLEQALVLLREGQLERALQNLDG